MAIRVRALRDGFHGGYRRRGEAFVVPGRWALGSWMEIVAEAPPASAPGAGAAVAAAVRRLDPHVDLHWTQRGLPRVEAVVALSRVEGLRRADIEEAAPGYTRSTARLRRRIARGTSAENERTGP